MKPRKFTVSPKAVTASRDKVSAGTDDHRTNSRLLIGTNVEATLGYAIDGLIDIFTTKLEQSADNISFANKNLRGIQYFVSIIEDCMPDDLTDYKISRRDMIMHDVDSCDTITSGESIKDKNGLTAYAVTFGWDDGGPESGPIWRCGTDVIYAESADEACAKWEAAYAGQFDIYEGCSAREATPEEVAYDNMMQEFENWEDDLPFGEEN